ncbi:MAG: hypothetical protein ACNYPI_07655 [Arenicellales bacterium WSBS_2016_MAG_OTU3]
MNNDFWQFCQRRRWQGDEHGINGGIGKTAANDCAAVRLYRPPASALLARLRDTRNKGENADGRL